MELLPYICSEREALLRNQPKVIQMNGYENEEGWEEVEETDWSGEMDFFGF